VALNKQIADSSVASNPLAEAIEQCDGLIAFCEKRMGKTAAEESKGAEEAKT
jgi:hypothetical protein